MFLFSYLQHHLNLATRCFPLRSLALPPPSVSAIARITSLIRMAKSPATASLLLKMMQISLGGWSYPHGGMSSPTQCGHPIRSVSSYVLKHRLPQTCLDQQCSTYVCGRKTTKQG